MTDKMHVGRDGEGKRLFKTDEAGDTWVKVDLSRDGVLTMVNRVIFHPRGYALGYDERTGDFSLTGNGLEPWSFEFPGSITQELHFAFGDLLLDTASANGSAIAFLFDPQDMPENVRAGLQQAEAALAERQSGASGTDEVPQG